MSNIKNARRFVPNFTQKVVAFFYHPRFRCHVSQMADGFLLKHNF